MRGLTSRAAGRAARVVAARAAARRARSSVAALPLAELERIDGAEPVLAALTDARLLTASDGEVEISHEALLTDGRATASGSRRIASGGGCTRI